MTSFRSVHMSFLCLTIVNCFVYWKKLHRALHRFQKEYVRTTLLTLVIQDFGPKIHHDNYVRLLFSRFD